MKNTQSTTVRAQHLQTASTENREWQQAYWKARRTRLKRVQTSAGVWLGVLTTLLGLVGSVVLLKGGSLITDVTTERWLQWVLFVLVGSVFFYAVLAVITCGVATWGGLKDVAPQRAASADMDSSTAPEPPSRQRRAWQRYLVRFVLWLTGVPKDDRKRAINAFARPDYKEKQHPAWRRALRKQFIKLTLRVAFIPSDDRENALHLLDRSARDEKGLPAYKQYEENIEANAERNRIYLHASRVLGVLAAFSIAVLAVVAILAGTFAAAPSDVIVVYHGQFTCVPVSDSAKFTDVTQVISVSGC